MLRNVRARLSAICAAGLLALLPASGALAQGAPFEEAFERELKSLMLNLPCAVERSERVEVLFVGVPADDPHISESMRRDLNARAVNEINRTGSFRANPIEVMGEIAALAGGPDAAHEIRATLAERRSAPALLIMSARRPSSEVMELKVDLSGRQEGLGYSCTQTSSLFLDVRTFEEVDRPEDFELMTLKGATRDAMRRLGAVMPQQEPVSLNVTVNLDGMCSFRRQFPPQLRAAIADARRAARSAGEDAPAMTASSGATPYVLSVNVWPSGLADDVLAVEYTMMRGDIALDTAFRNVVVNPTVLRGCGQQAAEAVAADPGETDAIDAEREAAEAARLAAEREAEEAARREAAEAAEAKARQAAVEEQLRRLQEELETVRAERERAEQERRRAELERERAERERREAAARASREAAARTGRERSATAAGAQSGAVFTAFSSCYTCNVTGRGVGATPQEAIQNAISACIGLGGNPYNCQTTAYVQR